MDQQASSQPDSRTTTPSGDVGSLSFETLDEASILRQINHPSAGASVLFVGTTRDNFKGQFSLSYRERERRYPSFLSTRPSNSKVPCSSLSLFFSNPTGKKVTRLEYESYTPLALKTLQRILLRARSSTWPPPPIQSNFFPSPNPSSNSALQTDPLEEITKIIIVHRLGVVPVSESSIVVAVSSPHRRKAFQVAEWCLEEVKKEAQIWKKEIYEESGGIMGLLKGKGEEGGTWKANFFEAMLH